MKKSGKPADQKSDLDLEFPDWSGMDDSPNRITPEAAFELSVQYPLLLSKAQLRELIQSREKCAVEFVL